MIEEVLLDLYRRSGLAYDYGLYKALLIAGPASAVAAAAVAAYLALPRLFPAASIALGAVAGLAAFAAVLSYPLLLIARRRNSFESNLVYTLSVLMPMLAAGMPLRDALAAAAEVEDDPEIARELKLVARDISLGKEPLEALEASAQRVPSPAYREVVRLLRQASRATERVDLVLSSRVDWMIRMKQIRATSLARTLTVVFEVYIMAVALLPLLVAVLALSLSPLGAAQLLGIGVDPLFLMALMAFVYAPLASLAFYALFASARGP